MSTVEQSIGSDGVYLGYWVNWSRGSIKGATITLSRTNGGLLTAFIALFVTVVGTSFWRIACFALHHKLSSDGPQDGLYHQRQALLRNAASSSNGLIGMVRLGLAWRKVATKFYSRIIPFIAMSLTILASFAVAGVFSSRISTLTGDEVLVSSTDCGFLDCNLDQNVTDLYTKYESYVNQAIVSQANYAQACYTDNPSREDCPTFVKEKLPVTSTRNASCPFDDSICHSTTTNLRLDTGYINSHKHLGMNAPKDGRFLYRSVTHCAPLLTEGYSDTYNDTSDSLPYQFMRYHYGTGINSVAGENNFTYQYPVNQPDPQKLNNTSGFNQEYTLTPVYAHLVDGSYVNDLSTFYPRTELQRDDADITLYFLSANSIFFEGQSDDPWYSAHKYVTSIFPTAGADGKDTGEERVYVADNPATVLGCASQSQYCNPSLPEDSRCGPLTGSQLAAEAAADLWDTDLGKNKLEAFDSMIAAENFDIWTLVNALGVSSLTSRYSRIEGLQAPLPDNQWQLEVEHWHSTMLAYMQRAPVAIATGPTDSDVMEYLSTFDDADEKSFLCENQKIISTNYSNYSLLALIITFVLGGIIIVIAYTMERVVALIQKRWKLNSYSRIEWTTNGTLELQRLAHEELGLGTWERTMKEVPVTSQGQFLGILDLSDPEHPRLKAPAPASDEDALLDGSSNENVENDDETSQGEPVVLQQEDSASRPVSGVSSLEHGVASGNRESAISRDQAPTGQRWSRIETAMNIDESALSEQEAEAKRESYVSIHELPPRD